MGELKLYLLGPPRVELDGIPVDIQRRKALALLTYLAVGSQPYSRDTLATLFWPDHAQSRARAYLRRDLAALNTTLSGDWLVADRDTIQLKPGFWLDITRFQQLLAASQSHNHPANATCSDCLEKLTEAAGLYTGDFLAGFTLRDSPEFDDWQFFQSESLHQDLAVVLAQLVKDLFGQKEYEKALPYARRWLALDPLYEPALRQLIEIYDHLGQPAAALRQYEEYVPLLEAELGLPPEEETTTLYEAIKAKRMLAPFMRSEEGRTDRLQGQSVGQVQVDPVLEPGADQTRAEAAGVNSGTPAAARPAAPAPQRLPSHNLPPPLTSFVGREKELAEIKPLLLNDPACRMLTLVGPGGIGKTRLAVQVARLLVETAADQNPFGHGILFVPLASVNTTSGVISAIAEAANFKFYNNLPPGQQLLDYLSDKQMLLVLDNVEQILDPDQRYQVEALLSNILGRAPGIKMMVTSREAVNVQEAWFYPVNGMPFPEDSSTHNKPVLEYDAIRLFVQNARRVQVNFSLEENQEHVVRICQLVDGVPLAIELATAWLKVLTAESIVREITRSLDILTAQHRNVSPRHSSMRIVLEQSWALLDAHQRDVLRRLSIFRGGFRQEAVEQIIGVSLMTLVILVEKSFVRASPSGRYQMHELLRQFAGEKLKSTPEVEETARGLHSRYYLEYLEVRGKDLIGPNQSTALNDLDEEMENIQLAWQCAVEQYKLETVDRACESLYRYYQIRNRYPEGETIFKYAAVHLEKAGGAGQPDYERVLSKVRARYGALRFFLGDYAAASAQLQDSLETARRLDHKTEIAFCLNILGQVAGWQGQITRAKELLTDSLALSLEIVDRVSMAEVLERLAQIYVHLGEYTGGKYLAEESLAMGRQVGRPDWIARALDTLGWATYSLGEYEAAERYYQESLKTFEKAGDKNGISLALGGLALVASAANRANAAEVIEQTEQGLALSREIGHQLHIASRLTVSAWIAIRAGQFARGQEYAQESLDIAQELGNLIFIPYNLCILAETACELGQFELSRKHILKALQITTAAQLTPQLLEALIRHAALLLKESVALEAGSRLGLQKKTAALEQLIPVVSHPKCRRDLRDQAKRLLAQLEAGLPADVVVNVKARAENRSPEDAALEILKGNVHTSYHPSGNTFLIGQRFKREALIAAGGMGEVYLGWDIETGQRVAIKQLKPELAKYRADAVERLLREGQVLRQLDHPNIVKVLATVETDGHPTIVMEYVSGGSLQDLLTKQPQLPLDRAIEIGLELADALARVHHLGIIHRDLKPANILLAEDGTPRLTDFGVASLTQEETRLTREGAILGTSAYMSPEAWRGEELDARSDIWSFATVLYEILAGRPPFAAKQIAAIVTAILHDRPPDLLQFRPDAPPVLAQLIERMLVKERKLRLESMRQVAAGLEVVQRNLVPLI